MFGIGSTELIVILIVALIVIGPAKLPEMAKSLGKALGEFRRVSTDVKRTIEMEAEQSEQKVKTEQAKKELFPETVAKAPAESEATAAPVEPEAAASAAPEQSSVQSTEKEKDKA